MTNKKKGRPKHKQPRPPELLRKGGPMSDKTRKLFRKRKHKGVIDNEIPN